MLFRFHLVLPVQTAAARTHIAKMNVEDKMNIENHMTVRSELKVEDADIGAPLVALVQYGPRVVHLVDH
jgi:hypothetical protein